MVFVLLVAGCGKGGADSASGAGAGPSTAATGSWKEFDPEQGKFTIKLPGDPQPLPGNGAAAKVWARRSQAQPIRSAIRN